MSAILGYTEALREGKLPGAPGSVDTLHTKAQHLQHLVDDVRTLSPADAGKVALARHAKSIGEVHGLALLPGNWRTPGWM